MEQLKTIGPKMEGVSSTFPTTTPFEKGVVIVTEVCNYPDGRTSEQKILVAETQKGWRVLHPQN